MALWSEFTPFEELREQLPELARLRISLYLAVHEASSEQKELFELLKEAQSLGLEVRPWLLLDKEKGYWPNVGNLSEFSSYCHRFLDSCEREGIAPNWLILDLEPHLELTLELEKLLMSRRYLRARKLLHSWKKESADPWESMERLILSLKERGVQIMAVTTPLVLDDSKRRLQELLGIPVDGLPWDEVSFMVYRPYFWDQIPGMPAEVVRLYGLEARRRFGDRAALALGPVGSPMVTQSQHFYRSPEGLHEDLAAAAMAGVHRISVFSLEGVREQGRLEDFLVPAPVTVRWSMRARLFRLLANIGIRLV